MHNRQPCCAGHRRAGRTSKLPSRAVTAKAHFAIRFHRNASNSHERVPQTGIRGVRCDPSRKTAMRGFILSLYHRQGLALNRPHQANSARIPQSNRLEPQGISSAQLVDERRVGSINRLVEQPVTQAWARQLTMEFTKIGPGNM